MLNVLPPNWLKRLQKRVQAAAVHFVYLLQATADRLPRPRKSQCFVSSISRPRARDRNVLRKRRRASVWAISHLSCVEFPISMAREHCPADFESRAQCQLTRSPAPQDSPAKHHPIAADATAGELLSILVFGKYTAHSETSRGWTTASANETFS